jgi:hypothetical protein
MCNRAWIVMRHPPAKNSFVSHVLKLRVWFAGTVSHDHTVLLLITKTEQNRTEQKIKKKLVEIAHKKTHYSAYLLAFICSFICSYKIYLHLMTKNEQNRTQQKKQNNTKTKWRKSDYSPKKREKDTIHTLLCILFVKLLSMQSI